MLIERVLALPPRDIVAEALVRLHGPGWRVTSLSEHHVELTGRRGGPDWPFVAFPLLVLVGHIAFLVASVPESGVVTYDRLLRFGLLAWPMLIVGLVAYHFLRRRPAAITVTALPHEDGARLIARAEGSSAAQEDLEYFLDHIVGVMRERVFGDAFDEAVEVG